jgi:hypothetical protein
MHAAACLGPADCWFAGDSLPQPQVGAFELHWNGSALEPQPYLPEGRAVRDMAAFGGRLIESTRILSTDRVAKQLPRPPALRGIKASFEREESPFEPVGPLPLYSKAEFSTALDYLHLSSAEGALWAAAGPQLQKPPASREAGVTIIRKPPGEEQPWVRVIAPQAEEEEEAVKPPPGAQLFPESALDAIAAEPGTESAWVALDSLADARSPSPLAAASVARVSAEGAVSDRLELPAAGDPHGPLGAAGKIVCPAQHDCWLATSKGWLVHLATAAERESPSPEADPVFTRIESEEPITFRPHDEGIPQEPSDEIPADISGESGFNPETGLVKPPKKEPVQVPVPLLSHVHSRLIHRTTLELMFHLAVRARVRLIAERHHAVVAATHRLTLHAGNRSLKLTLNPRRWPTKLNLQTHALAPLPTQTTAAPNVNSISTAFVAPARLLSAGLIP